MKDLNSVMNKSIYKKVGNSNWDVDNNTSRSELNDFLDLTNSSKSSTGKKKSKSSKKKKSDHKHDFYEVLLRLCYKDPLTGKEKKSLHLGKKCRVCGKLKETQWFITESTDDGYRKILSYDETVEKYPDYEIIDYI
jgi:hypothetical protein